MRAKLESRDLLENIKDTFSGFFDKALVFEQGIQFSRVKVKSSTLLIDAKIDSDLSLLDLYK